MYMEILARRWRIVLLVAVVVTCLAAVGGQFISPKYQAVAMLRIITPLGGSSDSINYQTTFATRLVNTYAQIAVSEQVKNEIKEKLDLQTLPDISVKVIPDSEIIQIVVESESSALTAKTANTLADMLLSYQDDAIATNDSKELNILAARKEELKASLAQAQQQHDQLVTLYSQTVADMTILDGTIQMKELTYQNLQAQYEQIVVQEAAYASSVTKATRDALTKELERIGMELDALNRQYKDLSARSNEYQQKITLARQMIQSTQSAYSALLAQYDDVALANSRQENAHTIEIVSPASEPAVPSGPGRFAVLILGVICGLILGVIAAFLIDNLDPRIVSLEQAGQITTVPIIGSISKYQSKNYSDIEKDPAVQRDSWLLRAGVQALIRDGSTRNIMVTSPNRKEGKSTIVFRLASGLAQSRLKTLIVDVNLRRPEQHKLFNVTAECGLSDFLGGEVESVEKVILKDVRPGLDLLPNLAESDNPIGMLQSPRWNDLFQAIAAYDVVIFDAPAFLAFPDTLDLVKAVDGVIIVAQLWHTTNGDLQSVCDYLKSIDSKILGVVVNRSTARMGMDFYRPALKQLQQVP